MHPQAVMQYIQGVVELKWQKPIPEALLESSAASAAAAVALAAALWLLCTQLWRLVLNNAKAGESTGVGLEDTTGSAYPNIETKQMCIYLQACDSGEDR